MACEKTAKKHKRRQLAIVIAKAILWFPLPLLEFYSHEFGYIVCWDIRKSRALVSLPCNITSLTKDEIWPIGE